MGSSNFDTVGTVNGSNWVRPDSSITVKLGPEVDTAKKMFLRLTVRAKVSDFYLDINQIHRRIIEVKIPETMRAGIYETSIVDENGMELGAFEGS